MEIWQSWIATTTVGRRKRRAVYELATQMKCTNLGFDSLGFLAGDKNVLDDAQSRQHKDVAVDRAPAGSRLLESDGRLSGQTSFIRSPIKWMRKADDEA